MQGGGTEGIYKRGLSVLSIVVLESLKKKNLNAKAKAVLLTDHKYVLSGLRVLVAAWSGDGSFQL